MNVALFYKSIKLRLLQPPHEIPLLIFKITICLNKGKRKRNAFKIIIFYKNLTSPAMYLIFYFIAITFADNAFYPRLINAGLSPHSLYNFLSPDSRITIDFTFKNNILEIPIFSCFQQSIQGLRVDFKRAFSANFISFWMKRLGQRARFKYSLQSYAFRCEVGTELTGLLYNLFHTSVPKGSFF